MRNWKRRTRALHKAALRLWANSDSDNWSPRLNLKRKHAKLFDQRHKRREAFIRKELQIKTHYEDCSYHPCKILSIDVKNDDIEGKSLIDGTEPRSCSLHNCGVVFFTEREAKRRATYLLEHGEEKYHEVYKSLADKDYTWTERFFGLSDVDAIEISGVKESGEGYGCERVTDDAVPDFFSVYIHKPGLGSDCVADRNTLDQAKKYAYWLASTSKLPVYDLTKGV